MRPLEGDASRIGAWVAIIVACAVVPACGQVTSNSPGRAPVADSAADADGAAVSDAGADAAADATMDAAAPADASAESASEAGNPCASFFPPNFPPNRPVLVCFGPDAAPYSQYLNPDAGIGVGDCPSLSDFLLVSQKTCDYSIAGPLPVSAVPSDAAANTCCFWISDSSAVRP